MPVEFLENVDWGWLVGIAAGVGAVAMGWSRILELIDTWLVKTVRSGHRGYFMLFGVALRYWTPWTGWRLFVIPPFIYPQVFLVLKVESFSIQLKPLDSNEQIIRNKCTGKVYRMIGKATIEYSRRGDHVLLSQVKVDNPEGVFYQMMQGVVAKVISEATPDILSDYNAINEQTLEQCNFPDACGIRMISFRVTTLAPVDAQIHKDGLTAIADSV